MKKLMVNLALFFISYPCISADIEVRDQYLGFKDWKNKCVEVRDFYKEIPSSYITFDDLNIGKELVLETNVLLDGIQLPLPEGFSKINKFRDYGDSYRLEIKNENSYIVVSSEISNFYVDYWQKGDNTTKEGEAFTNKVYGEAINVQDIFREGFSVTPDDVNCVNNSRFEDVRYLNAIHSKTYLPLTYQKKILNNSEFPKVYDFENKEYRGFLKVEKNDIGMSVEVLLFNDAKTYTVLYFFSNKYVRLLEPLLRSFYEANTN